MKHTEGMAVLGFIVGHLDSAVYTNLTHQLENSFPSVPASHSLITSALRQLEKDSGRAAQLVRGERECESEPGRGPDRLSERYRHSCHCFSASLPLTVPRAVPTDVCASAPDPPCSAGWLRWLISCLLGAGEYFTVIAGHEDAPQEGRWHGPVARGVHDRPDQLTADRVRDTLAPTTGIGRPGTLCAGHLAAWWALGHYRLADRGGDQCQCAADLCR